MRQVIYVVAETKAGPCKVGVATDMAVRIVGLQNGNPRKLILAHVREIDWPNRLEIERVAHALMGAANRLSGEWFAVTVEDAIRAVNEACEMMGRPDMQEALEESAPPPLPEPAPRADPFAKVVTRPPSETFLARRSERERKRFLMRPR